MEIRVLQNFLTIAKEGSITNAAAKLNISQPTLSRQIQDLEKQLGCRLFVRRSHSVRLTTEGMMLRKRALEITKLVDKTEREMNKTEEVVYTDIYIGAEETAGISYINKAAADLRKENPAVRFHIVSGNADEVLDQLETGLVDFGLVFEEEKKLENLHSIPMANKDAWGILLPENHPLAAKQKIQPQDLYEEQLILCRQSAKSEELKKWFGEKYDSIHVSGTYTDTINAASMVVNGLGAAICKKGLIPKSHDLPLVFRPFDPEMKTAGKLVWKRYDRLGKISEKFLEKLYDLMKLETAAAAA
jgi:DNA-binding transcriptional LysR family regulator